MKKIVLFFMGISFIFMILSCSPKEDSDKDMSSDYRPMIYVQDNLYGETAEVISILPDETINIGRVEKLVSQNEPMILENFTSNTLSVGSEIYYNESESDVVYVRLVDNEKEQYSKYSIIE